MQVLLWTSDSSAQAQAALTHPDSSTFAVRAVLSRTVQENQFAIPGVNVVSSSSVNACMEAAKKAGQVPPGTATIAPGTTIPSNLVGWRPSLYRLEALLNGNRKRSKTPRVLGQAH